MLIVLLIGCVCGDRGSLCTGAGGPMGVLELSDSVSSPRRVLYV